MNESQSCVEFRPERDGPSAWLKRATFVLVVTLAAVITVPALAFVVVPTLGGQGVREHDLGPLGDYPKATFVVATFTANPTQGSVSRASVFVRNNGFVANEPSFTILSSRDSYLGCPVEPNGQAFSHQQTRYRDVTLLPIAPSSFGSNCHDGVRYDTEGNRLSGPVPRALNRYSFSIRDDHLFIGKSFSVSHVDGTGATAAIHTP